MQNTIWNQPLTSIPTPTPSPLQERLNLGGYNTLLADYCQLVDQVADLVTVVVSLWESHQELRRRLDLPRQPLPLAGSLACAARSAALPASVALAGEES